MTETSTPAAQTVKVSIDGTVYSARHTHTGLLVFQGSDLLKSLVQEGALSMRTVDDLHRRRALSNAEYIEFFTGIGSRVSDAFIMAQRLDVTIEILGD